MILDNIIKRSKTYQMLRKENEALVEKEKRLQEELGSISEEMYKVCTEYDKVSAIFAFMLGDHFKDRRQTAKIDNKDVKKYYGYRVKVVSCNFPADRSEIWIEKKNEDEEE